MLSKIARRIRSLKIGSDRDIITAGMVHDSLDRLTEGSFGKCDRCGRSISAGMLAANPVARLCAECGSKPARPLLILAGY